MKALFLSVLLLGCPIAAVGCKSAPSERVSEVRTLKGVGAAVSAGMRVSAQLLKDGKITRSQWDMIAKLHDTKIQPTFNLAVAAVQADLSRHASAELMALVGQFLALIESFKPAQK